MLVVNDLVDDDVVTSIPDEQVLVHEPSDEAFDSILQLAVFHRGWIAACDIDGEDSDATDALWLCLLRCGSRYRSWEGAYLGKDERVTHPICVDCAIQSSRDPDDRDHHACDSCGLIVDALAALTRFRVELGHLEGPLQLCARCSPGGPATYWTRDLDDHLVSLDTES